MISPRLLLDDDYRGFLELTAGHIATAVASARAYEEERTRAEALAEIDRAKTVFFSNVSHEFRTPLTLILGPTEEILSGALGETTEIQRAHLTTLRRNAVRLQKLVNTLLDYARSEGGRMEASFEPVDIGVLTRELASAFCSAVHRAGLLYIVNCPSINEPVYVVRDLWEKIVLNLLSNALKFTFKGVIEVSLRSVGDRIAIAVRDTGVGIPEDQLPRLSDRFHRVPGSRARTQEGSGIGLALVQELVKLHGGSLQVESAVDSGRTFVEDGAKALEAVRTERCDLVLSDVMMPRLDGFELLRQPREDSRTATIPVVLLSARVGEKSYIAGMNAGADDYIVKPFGARELIARVKALLEMTRLRRESEQRVTNILESITDGFQVIDADWRLTYLNSEAKRVLGEHGIHPDASIGKHYWDEVFPEGVTSTIAKELRRAMAERLPVAVETYYEPWDRWYFNRVYPLPEGGLAHYFLVRVITGGPARKGSRGNHLMKRVVQMVLKRRDDKTVPSSHGEDAEHLRYTFSDIWHLDEDA